MTVSRFKDSGVFRAALNRLSSITNITARDVDIVTKRLDAVTNQLRYCYQHKDDDPGSSYAFGPFTDFDLNLLEEAADEFYRYCDKYVDQEAEYKAFAVNRIRGLHDNLFNKTSTAHEQNAAKMAALHSRCMLENAQFLCSLRLSQLFNVEKRFSFEQESYSAIMNEDEKRAGRLRDEEVPLSLRQKWNDPENLVEHQPKPSRKQEKKRHGLVEVATLLKRNCASALKEVRAIENLASDKEVQLPNLPTDLLFSNVPVPANVPKKIRQRLFDLDFVYQQIEDSIEDLTLQHDHVGATIMFWSNSGDGVWEYGKEHIHEMADMRKYEYNRKAMEALRYIAARERGKIVEYFQSKEGAPSLTPDLEEALKPRIHAKEDIEKDSRSQSKKYRVVADSVDEMLAQMDRLMKGEEIEQDNDWWKYLVPPSPT